MIKGVIQLIFGGEGVDRVWGLQDQGSHFFFFSKLPKAKVPAPLGVWKIQKP